MIETEEFLSHYGVPGMKWGVRRQNLSIAKNNVRQAKQLLKDAKTERKEVRKAAVKTVAKDAVVAAGAVAVVAILAKNKSKSMKTLRQASEFSKGSDWVNANLKKTVKDAAWATTKIRDL